MTKPSEKYNKYDLTFEVYNKDGDYEDQYTIKDKVARDHNSVIKYARRNYCSGGQYIEIVELKRTEEAVSILD